MKGINISCSSHSSTSFYTPISMDQATSSSSSSSSSSLFPVTLLGGSTGGGGGSRMIDRHNPIITDERRVSRSTPPSSTNSTPFFTPKSSPFSLQKKTPKKTKNTSAGNAKRLIGLTPKIKSKSKAKSNGGHDYDDDHEHTIQALKKDASQPSDLITIKGASKAAVDHHISPPESSRYLLGDPVQEIGSGFFDRALSDFDPFLKLEDPFEEAEPEILASARKEELVLEPELKTSNSAKPPLPPHPPPKSNSSTSDQQVVVLRVSLHCRGCEGKVRKHISRMQGVRSFTIDFAAKKVTVVGDVTPLEVLASISKVKNAQIWTPPLPSNSKSMDPFTHNKF